MGRIYKARAKYTGQTVALKILKSEYMEDETLKDRFFREAEVVGALDHPHIVKLYGCAPVPEHNTIYMAMEFVSFSLTAKLLLGGVMKLMPSEAAANLILYIGIFMLRWLLLYFLYKKKIFLKV